MFIIQPAIASNWMLTFGDRHPYLLNNKEMLSKLVIYNGHTGMIEPVSPLCIMTNTICKSIGHKKERSS